MSRPSAVRTNSAGSAISQTSRTVGAARLVMSTSLPSRTVTTTGPPASASQARPTKVRPESAWLSMRRTGQ
jgi:hypothetical protein